MTRGVLFIVLILSYLTILFFRLPDWDSDKPLWLAAYKTDPKDPWAVVNAAHFTRDKNFIKYEIELVNLRVPLWFSADDKSPYLMGYDNFIGTLRSSGYELEAERIHMMRINFITNRTLSVTYVTR